MEPRDEQRLVTERVGAVVLCAGSGSRFQSADHPHKLRAPLFGRPVVAHAVEHALRAGFAQTFVVTGAVVLNDVLPPDVQIVENERWAEGQATSLQAALLCARAASLEAVVVGLGDQPFIMSEAWGAVGRTPAALAVATYEGKRRNPVRLHASIWDLVPTSGDEGARVLMRTRPELVVEVPCGGDPVDIDTVLDWQELG